MVYPTALTVVYFILLAKHPQVVQQLAYAVGKVIQFGFPISWVFIVQRGRPEWQSPRGKDLAIGLAAGLLMLGPVLAMYYFWLGPAGAFDGAASALHGKAADLGVQSAPRFIMLSVFYCVAHSALEEYYWRWFVFAQLRRFASFPVAAIGSSLTFMSHHVFVLAIYFGWGSPLTYCFSLAVAVGGFIWSFMYEKTGSLWGTWLSHALIDAAIFIVGYDLLMRS
jgi:membrane protease YdiL (CAAX protease family)